MRMTLGTRVTISISLLLALTLACGFGAIQAALEMERQLDAMASSNLPSVVAANELQQALLQQRGIVAAYFLEGHPGWLTDLDRIKPLVSRWMVEARRTAHTAEERLILERLDDVYTSYDGEREHAIQLYASGHPEDARNVLLRNVSLLAAQAQALCDQLVAANLRYAEESLQDGHRRVARLRSLLMVGMIATVLLGLSLLAFLLHAVLGPMRRLSASAKAVTPDRSASARTQFSHEMGELEYYSQALITDVSRTRLDLEDSHRRLLTAEKLAAVGQFAACVAHEIRSPLTALRLRLYELQQAASGDPQVDQSCRILGSELHRLEKLATSFLEYSRPPRLEFTASDVSTIVSDTLELAEPRLRERGLTTMRVNGKPLPHVMADAHQLRQVLLNLVTNAAEATPAGGEVRITEALETEGCDRPEVVVRVADAGSGVPETMRTTLFEPFVSSKPHGTGLGLCIASNIVSQHGGRLLLESTSGRGSVFAMRIPVAEG